MVLKRVTGMEYRNYVDRIKPLKIFDTFGKPPNEYKEVGRFSVKKGNMTKTKPKLNFLNLMIKDFISQTTYSPYLMGIPL